MAIRECMKMLTVNLMINAVDPGFMLKVAAFCLMSISTFLWRIQEGGYTGMKGTFQEVLFMHTVPGYNTLVFGLIVAFLLEDRPNCWFYVVFYGAGVVLFVIVAFLGLFNCTFYENDWGKAPLIMVFTNFLTAIVLALDFLWSTRLFGVYKWFISKTGDTFANVKAGAPDSAGEST